MDFSGWIRYCLYMYNKQMAKVSQMVLSKEPTQHEPLVFLYKDLPVSMQCQWREKIMAPHHQFILNSLNYQKPLIIFAISFLFYEQYRCVLHVFAWAGSWRTIYYIFLTIEVKNVSIVNLTLQYQGACVPRTWAMAVYVSQPSCHYGRKEGSWLIPKTSIQLQ